MDERVQNALEIIKDIGGDDPVLEIDALTAEDFDTTKPYEYLMHFKNRQFEMDILEKKLQRQAIEVGFKGFITRWRRYQKQSMFQHSKPVGNITSFTGMNYTALNSGEWFCTDNSIYTRTGDGFELVACTHPILPIQRLVNVDTGTVKIRLAYRPGNVWKEIIVERAVLASPQKIIELANHDVAVTSESAKYLIRYLADVEAINYDSIPERKSTTRLGWVSDDIFLPYTDDIEFDGHLSFRSLFDAIKQVGNFDEWKNAARDFRRMDRACRVALAASFASPLLVKIDALSMFVHLWAPISGTGKTVMVMFASSVWGNPETGQYTQTFNSTEVASEWTAAFLKDLPIVMDELQLARDRYGNLRFSVYKLAQGTGRARGTKTGGLEKTPTWRLCCITTGETPLTKETDGAGAFARIIDVELDQKIIDLEAGQRIVKTIAQNYGHAGKAFIEAVQKIPPEELQARYAELTKIVMKSGDVQDKQAMSAAALLLADEIVTKYILDDPDGQLHLDDILPFLQSSEDISIESRAYEYLLDWIAANSARFKASNDREQFGTIELDNVFIIRSKFNEVMTAAGFSPRSVVSALYKAGKINVEYEGDKKRFDVRKNIDGNRCRCISLIIRDVDDEYISFEY